MSNVTLHPNKDPRTPQEWQEAVDIAHGALALDSARQYGLVRGGPGVWVERAEEILRLGAAKGYKPSPNAVERFVAAVNFLNASLNSQ